MKPIPRLDQIRLVGVQTRVSTGKGEQFFFYGSPEVVHNFQVGGVFPAFAYSGHRRFDAPELKTIEPLRVSPRENALDFEKSIRPGVFVQWVANNRTQWALAKADGDTESADYYDKPLNRISSFISEVCELSVEFKLERSPLRLELRIEDEPVPLDVLPDGLKSILGWLGDLILRLDGAQRPGDSRDLLAAPMYLFLDEIGIDLHPKWQRLVLPALQRLLPQAEIFVSTHSPFVAASAG